MDGGLKLPGHVECEYLLVIQPNEDLHEKIMEEKNNFAEKYNAAAATFGKPYITLLRFVQVQMMEERIIRQLRAIASGCAPVKIELRNFGSFPSHTIFINLVSKVQVHYIIRRLKTAQRLMKYKENTPHFITEPHLAIARKLKPEQYESAWKEYQHQSFSGRFIAGKLVLLRRPYGLRSFQLVEAFELADKQIQSTQGSLFL